MKRIKIRRFEEVSFEFMEDVADSTFEPYAVLRAKTQHLAELLDCDEATAERILLDRLGAS
jgi:hypothetical protein